MEMPASSADAVRRRILRADVLFPKSFSPAATSLIRQLLTRDPAKRLGGRGAGPIKKHAFFKVSLHCLQSHNHIVSFLMSCTPRYEISDVPMC